MVVNYHVVVANVQQLKVTLETLKLKLWILSIYQNVIKFYQSFENEKFNVSRQYKYTNLLQLYIHKHNISTVKLHN